MSLSTIMTDKVQNTTSNNKQQREANDSNNNMKSSKSNLTTATTLFDTATDQKLDSPLFDEISSNNKDTDVTNNRPNKESLKLLSCCGIYNMNLRKAVVIVNIINIIIVLGSLLCTILLKKLVADHTVIVDNNGTTDIDLDADLVTFVQSIELSIQSILLSFIRITCSIIAMIGAYKKKPIYG